MGNAVSAFKAIHAYGSAAFGGALPAAATTLAVLLHDGSDAESV